MNADVRVSMYMAYCTLSAFLTYNRFLYTYFHVHFINNLCN